MGVAAYNRASSVISKRIAAESAEYAQNKEYARAASIAAECDAYVRAVMDDISDPRGLRANTMIRFANKPKAQKLRDALIDSHNKWVDAPEDTKATAILSINRAKAAHALYMYLLQSFNPKHGMMQPPRCVL